VPVPDHVAWSTLGPCPSLRGRPERETRTVNVANRTPPE
jgi:hypothetical protein